MPSSLRALGSALALAWRAWPAGVAAKLVFWTLAFAGQGVIQALALEACVAAIARGRPSGAIVWFALLGFSTVTPNALLPLNNHIQEVLIRRTAQAATQAVMKAAAAPAGVEHLENPRFADRLEVVRSQSDTIAFVVESAAGAVSTGLIILVSLVLLAGVQPILLLPVLAVGAVSLLHVPAQRRSLRIYERSVSSQRLADNLEQQVTGGNGAEDLRLLGTSRWLIGRHRSLTRQVTRTMARAALLPVAVSAADGLAEAAILAGGLILLVHLAIGGHVTAGQVALGVVLLRNALSSAGSVGSTGSSLSQNIFAAQRYLWLLDYKPAVVQSTNPRPVPTALTRGIDFHHVTFTYPGTDVAVLQDIDLHLPGGTTVALVGDNGAGKTTLIKLLARLYDPTAGHISVDDIDLRDVDLVGWRRAMTATFQDFVQFHFRAGESIGIGDLQQQFHPSAITAAVSRGGAYPVIEGLPYGFDTQLGSEFPDGVNLSTGQWQKLAVSRSAMRTTPLLTVLDEPTAALDPRAEHELFEHYARAAKVNARHGCITLLASHRFSTVQMAELIVVLHGGRVTETGTHQELLERDGQYAKLYALQHARYS